MKPEDNKFHKGNGTEPEGRKLPYYFRTVAGNIILNSSGSVEAHGLICAALADAYAAGRASREPLREALKKIAGADYRGNRSSESILAFNALAADKEEAK